MSEEKFIHTILALGGIIAVLVLTVMSYQNLIQDKYATSTEARGNVYYMCGNACSRRDANRSPRRQLTRTFNGVRFRITCQQEPGTSRYVWTCNPL